MNAECAVLGGKRGEERAALPCCLSLASPPLPPLVTHPRAAQSQLLGDQVGIMNDEGP